MARRELDLLLGGAQGAGLDTSANVLTTAFARLGYGITSDREYFSNIKGRHSYVHARISTTEIPQALTYPVQVVGAMDAETIFTHHGNLEDGGYLIFDKSTSDRRPSSISSVEPDLMRRLENTFAELKIDGTVASLVEFLGEVRKVKLVELRYPDILAEVTKKFKLRAAYASRYISSILVGAVAGLVNLDGKSVRYGLERRFAGRPEVIEQNSFVVDYVSDVVKGKYGSPHELGRSQLGCDELMVASGNDVVAMAKIVGGMRYQSYYPITPAADESFFLESSERLEVNGESLGSVIVIQTEDEIAAINSAIGAALTGARSATATSGPGFCLMVEGLGWAGINEVPLVVTYYQRGGPSTGQPTRGTQGDLLFALSASHGEFPKIVLSSGDHLEAFYDAIEAFNLAERYQTPVIHLLDKFLANSIATLKVPKLSALKIERGKISYNPPKDYKRFDLNDTISPRAFLGSKVVTWHTGDEHDEAGHVNEDPLNRVKMYDKRLKKLEIADREIPPEKRAVYFGSEDADFLAIGWGFVKGVVLDALKELSNQGLKGAYLHLKMFSPFPSDYVRSVVERFDLERVIVVEHDYLAQAGMVLTLNTGIVIEKAITKYTGRPMYTHELIAAIRRVINGEKRLVLSYGE
ncbi:MAG: 2-oxoacid:ferredoxin oxidoreductase subunit alpha [Nitrososphaeria archaeon]